MMICWDYFPTIPQFLAIFASLAFELACAFALGNQ